jgi:hypothetical protein
LTGAGAGNWLRIGGWKRWDALSGWRRARSAKSADDPTVVPESMRVMRGYGHTAHKCARTRHQKAHRARLASRYPIKIWNEAPASLSRPSFAKDSGLISLRPKLPWDDAQDRVPVSVGSGAIRGQPRAGGTRFADRGRRRRKKTAKTDGGRFAEGEEGLGVGVGREMRCAPARRISTRATELIN